MAFDALIQEAPPAGGAPRTALSLREKAALFDLAMRMRPAAGQAFGDPLHTDAVRLIQAFAEAYCTIRDREDGLV
jgi:hypothetical protein